VSEEESSRWLSPAEQQSWRRWLLLTTRLPAALNRRLQAESELSLSDFAVLVELTDVPDGRRRVLELGRDLQWEKSRLSHHLARMERRGLVCREETPHDGRGSLVLLTPAGKAAIEAAAPAHVAAVRQLFFDALTPAQVAALAEITDAVLARLEE